MELGLTSLPVILIGARRLSGFNPQKIDEALAATRTGSSRIRRPPRAAPPPGSSSGSRRRRHEAGASAGDPRPRHAGADQPLHARRARGADRVRLRLRRQRRERQDGRRQRHRRADPSGPREHQALSRRRRRHLRRRLQGDGVPQERGRPREGQHRPQGVLRPAPAGEHPRRDLAPRARRPVDRDRSHGRGARARGTTRAPARTTDEARAATLMPTAEVRTIFADIRAFYGTGGPAADVLGGEIPMPFGLIAHDPGYLADVWAAVKRAFSERRLTRRHKEALAFAVSLTTRSAFGTAFHLAELRRLGVGERGVMEIVGVTQMFSSYTKIADTLQLASDMADIAPPDAAGVPAPGAG